MRQKITLVTGAGRGIGEATAMKFLENGHFVYFIIHKKSQKISLIKRIKKYKSFKIFAGDLTKKTFLNKLSNQIDYCDNLINNAQVLIKRNS